MECRLCKRNRELRNSHIIPEFCFKPIYDNLHKFPAITTDKKEKTKFHQKGFREKLLCGDCEQLIASTEKYVSEVFNGGVEIGIKQEGRDIVISDIDYDKFKLFQLSILWRAGITSVPYFSEVDLGPHEEIIRNMILNKNPGTRNEYGCLMMILMLGPNQPLNEMIVSPDRFRRDGYICYRFILSGCLWLFVANRKPKNFRGADLFLSDNGVLRMPMVLAENVGMLRGMARRLKEAGKLDKK